MRVHMRETLVAGRSGTVVAAEIEIEFTSAKEQP